MNISLRSFKKSVFLAAMALLLASCASNSVKPLPTDVSSGEVNARTYFFEEAGKDMSYALYVPSTYDGSSETPLVVLLHGLTSNPDAVIGYEGLTEQAEKHGMIVVAPFGYNEGGWYGSRGHGNDFGMKTANMFTEGAPENLGELSELDVLNVMEIIREEFAIDNDRTYLMGHSMGGAGTLYLGIKYSDQWAALAQMSPAVFGGPRGSLDNIKNVPILTVQGDKDELVPVAMVRELMTSFDGAGLTSKYIEIPDGDHVRVIARNPELMAEVFNFLAGHSR
ncbi:carboxylesterase family protein [Gilvimarinus sp. F26214L]|uniref:carboxylesterase family protein n=1 Tax=Gilvimarinus sp. DZF01 TaxID=3461371 RepID=UPI004045F3EE